MMKIVHASDWHGKQYKLPYADMYIFTGDMYPNFRQLDFSFDSKLREHALQVRWGQNNPLDSFMENPNAAVVCVRGNHDYADSKWMFNREVYEIKQPEVVYHYNGLKIGGFRGIDWIAGCWSDEFSEAEFEEHIKDLATDLDIIVSHTPPKNILDQCLNNNYGSQAYTNFLNKNYIYGNLKPPKLLTFGHIHEDCDTEFDKYPFKVSNAATTFWEIEI